MKKIFFVGGGVYFDLKSMSKNKNQNFRIHFLDFKSKNGFQKVLSFFNFDYKIEK